MCNFVFNVPKYLDYIFVDFFKYYPLCRQSAWQTGDVNENYVHTFIMIFFLTNINKQIYCSSRKKDPLNFLLDSRFCCWVGERGDDQYVVDQNFDLQI
jgi:hypothetical protein